MTESAPLARIENKAGLDNLPPEIKVKIAGLVIAPLKEPRGLSNYTKADGKAYEIRYQELKELELKL